VGNPLSVKWVDLAENHEGADNKTKGHPPGWPLLFACSDWTLLVHIVHSAAVSSARSNVPRFGDIRDHGFGCQHKTSDRCCIL